MINRYPFQIQDAVIDAASDAVRDTWDGAYLARLGIISHFRNYPRADGTLLSVIGNEERPLQNGRCYVLDGDDDYVLTPTLASDDLITEITFWAHMDAEITSTSGAEQIMGSYGPVNYEGIGIGSIAGNITGETFTLLFSASDREAFTNDIPTGWHYYKVVWDGSKHDFYVDGVLMDYISVGTPEQLNARKISFGARIPGNITWAGKLFDFKITTASTFYHYKMDEQDGLTAYDSSGNGNHAEITNATLSSFHGTQGEYSFQNQVGYSRAFTEDDTLIVAGQTLTDISFDIDLMGETGKFIPLTDSGVSFLLTTESGSASATITAGFGTPSFTIDGVAFSGTRGELYTLFAVAGSHAVTVSLSASVDLYFGGFQTAAWGVDGQVISNVKVNGISYDGPTYLPRNESTPSQDVLGNTLQHRGQAKLIAKARENSCATFDGSNDYVTVPDNTALDITDKLSVTVRAENDNATLSAKEMLLSKYNHGLSKRGWAFFISDLEKLSLYLSLDGSSFGRWDSTDTISTEDMHSYGFTFEGGVALKVYLDGLEIAGSFTTGVLPASLFDHDLPLEVGSFSGNTSNWSGQIFDARIYDTVVLTAAEMLAIHNGTDTSVGATLKAHYPLSEGNGTVIHDTSPNANHGTATNITQSSFWGSTQDEYATNFVDGFTPYFTDDDTLIVAGQTLTSISFDIDLMGETRDLALFSDSASSNLFVISSGGAGGLGNLSGTPTFTIDGAPFSGTRGELYTLLAVAGPHTATITLSNTLDLYFGGFNSVSWGVTNQVISNVKVNGISYDGPTRVPAKSSTLDAYGNALTNPASPTHNDFEGVIDYREVGVLDATPPALDHIYTGAAEFDGVSGSNINFGSVTIGANETWSAEVEMMIPAHGDNIIPVGGNWNSQAGIIFSADGSARVFSKGAGDSATPSGVTAGTWFLCEYGVDATGAYAKTDGVEFFRDTSTTDQSAAITFDLMAGHFNASDFPYSILSAKFTIAGTAVLDIDFRKFNHKLRADYATSGQLVTLNGGVSFPKVIVPDALAYDDTYPKDYCEFDGANGSYVSVPSSAFGIDDFVLEVKDVTLTSWEAGGYDTLLAKWNPVDGNSFGFWRTSANLSFYANYNATPVDALFPHGLTGVDTASIRVTRAGTSLSCEMDTGSGYAAIGSVQTVPSVAIDGSNSVFEVGAWNSGVNDRLTGKIGAVKLTSSGTNVLDIDFSTANARNGLAETGQILTYNGGAAIPLSTLANPMFQRDDSWTRLFEVGLNDSDAAKQI